jgi:hypothetical protein
MRNEELERMLSTRIKRLKPKHLARIVERLELLLPAR